MYNTWNVRAYIYIYMMYWCYHHYGRVCAKSDTRETTAAQKSYRCIVVLYIHLPSYFCYMTCGHDVCNNNNIITHLRNRICTLWQWWIGCTQSNNKIISVRVVHHVIIVSSVPIYYHHYHRFEVWVCVYSCHFSSRSSILGTHTHTYTHTKR